MPAYFSLIVSVKKEKLTDNLFGDFVSLLTDSGFKYVGGLRDYENAPLSDIIDWNTDLLSKDFELEYSEDVSADYRQIVWKHRRFSSVRLFVCNSKEDDYFTLNLIIPESEVTKFNWDSGRPFFRRSVTQGLKNLAVKIYESGIAETIQTGLEEDEEVSPSDIQAGEMPSVNPFAIIPASYNAAGFGDSIKTKTVGGNAILITRKI